MSDLRPADLYGPSAAFFESCRRQGMTEVQALAEVRATGIVEQQKLFESAIRQGHGDAYATAYSQGRDGPAPTSADPFDAVVGRFERAGMSAEAAKAAAIGRAGSEAQARREMNEALRHRGQATAVVESADPIRGRLEAMSLEELTVEVARLDAEAARAHAEVRRLERANRRSAGTHPFGVIDGGRK